MIDPDACRLPPKEAIVVDGDLTINGDYHVYPWEEMFVSGDLTIKGGVLTLEGKLTVGALTT